MLKTFRLLQSISPPPIARTRIPPPPPPYPAPKFLEEMVTLNGNLRAPESQYTELEYVLSHLNQELVSRLGATRIAPFGSCSSGLWTKASDVDLTIIIPRCNSKIKIINKLKTARSILRRTMGASGFTVVENARIPVLKIQLTNKTISEVDISVNNISGIENSLLVKGWGDMDPRFTVLARCIKHWAKQRGINDRSKGTLSTYTILLQIVYFLQTQDVIPKFSTYAKSHVHDEFCELNGIERELPFHLGIKHMNNNDKNLHVLFKEFFELFGDESMMDGVEIVDGEIVSKGAGVLIMRCPLTGKDVNAMNSSVWKMIHAEYKRARDLVRSGSTLHELVSS